MKIGLVDVDGHNFPNYALMKISAYHKAQGDEVNDKIAKAIRKGKIRIEKNQLTFRNCDSDAMCDEIAKEISDCLWFISGLASVFGYTLEEIGQINLSKLASRKERGVIDGNGDNR